MLYDIAYVRRCSPSLDLLILCRTGFVMLLGESRTARPFLSTSFAAFVQPPDDFDIERPPASSK
jgi:hypothetical protein